MAYSKDKIDKCLKLANERISLKEISESESVDYRTLQRWVEKERDRENHEIVQEAKYNLNLNSKLPKVQDNLKTARLRDILLHKDYGLYEYQKNWLKDMSRFKIHFKSRQIGMTWVNSAEALIEASGGMEQTIISASEKQALIWGDYIKQHAQRLNINVKGSMSRLDVDGVNINIIANNPKTAQGYAGSVKIDEASWINKLERVYNIVLPIVSVKKVENMSARLAIFSTQFDEYSFFNKIFTDAIEFPTFSRHFTNIYEAKNDGLDVDIDALRDSMSAQAWEMFFECKFGDDENALFTRKMIKECIDVEIENRELLNNAIIECAFSTHKEKDIYAFIALQKVQEKYLLIARKEFNRATYKEQKEYLENFLKTYLKAKIKFEKRENSKFLYKDLRNLKNRVNSINFTKREQEELVFNLKKAFEDKKILIPNDPDLIREIYSIKKEGGENTAYIAQDYPVNFWTLALAYSVQNVGKGRAVIINNQS